MKTFVVTARPDRPVLFVATVPRLPAFHRDFRFLELPFLLVLRRPALVVALILSIPSYFPYSLVLDCIVSLAELCAT